MSRPHTYDSMVGQRFGSLTVFEILEAKGGKPRQCRCVCDCGAEKTKRCTHLMCGAVLHCGYNCPAVERVSIHRIYGVWQHIKQRCYNKNNPFYKHYGQRGIVMCDRWRNSFENFRDDMFSSFQEGLTLDRIDVNGGYCKENCRWADRETQDNNRTDTIFIEYNGEKMGLAQWARKLKISRDTIMQRYLKGLSPKEMLAQPKQHTKLTGEQVVEIKKMLSGGEYQRIIAEKIGGISRSTVLGIKLGRTWKNVKS